MPRCAPTPPYPHPSSNPNPNPNLNPQDGKLFGAGVALGALEIVSVAVFTADYAARVMSAAAEDDGRCPCGGGAMRYVASFYGVVDLFSVLPFFLGLPVCGGLRDLSPALLPTLVRALFLVCQGFWKR